MRFSELGVGAVAIVILFRHLQYSTRAICCGDFDGYYHMKWARLLWENIKAKHFFPPTFTWLPLTTLNPGRLRRSSSAVSHPSDSRLPGFVTCKPAGRLPRSCLPASRVFSCYWLIVRYEIRYRLLWLLALLASSAPFLYRMNMTKAPPLAILFLVIGTYLLFERKHWQLLPLALIFTLDLRHVRAAGRGGGDLDWWSLAGPKAALSGGRWRMLRPAARWVWSSIHIFRTTSICFGNTRASRSPPMTLRRKSATNGTRTTPGSS